MCRQHGLASNTTERLPGTAPITPGIRAEIDRTKENFRTMLADASLSYFPRDELRHVLEFWKVNL